MLDKPIQGGRPKSVLYVCNLNAIRSPIAEALTMKLCKDIYVASAGILKGAPDPFAQIIMSQQGVDIEAHNPRELEDLEDGFFDLVITLSEEADQLVRQKMAGYSVEIEHWPVADPSLVEGARGQILEAYQSLASDLEARILAHFGADAR